MDDEAETNAACEQDEGTQAEHEENLGSLAHGGVEIGEQRNGHHQDDDILRDAESSRGVGQSVHIEACVVTVTAFPTQPDVAEGLALEYLHKE